MPTSVLLAVLAAAGLLALAPALVRRYDAAERLVAERAQSTARVLERRRRQRTVPGRRPVNAGRHLVVRPVSGAPAGASSVSASADSSTADGRTGAVDGDRRLRAVPDDAGRRSAAGGSSRRSAVAGSARRSAADGAGRRSAGGGPSLRSAGGGSSLRSAGGAGRPRHPATRRHTPAVYRRRRVFAALLLLNLVELIGVALVSSGFWISFAVTGTLLGAYVVRLRRHALAARRRRRIEAREAAWLAARQAEVRREQARRAAARREAQRRLAAQREAVRRAAMGLDRGELPAAAAGAGGRTAASVSYRRTGGLRGRAYQAGRGSRPA
ncbi:hypothetical protein CIK06_03220 [Plantactinospora sp. KBS50]|nr:hypothetical protein [Plantactinospora sp. KBS50]ASW57390.1 hypothetical protein CIK06_03220 [Plantactinospora sp. KBS50]